MSFQKVSNLQIYKTWKCCLSLFLFSNAIKNEHPGWRSILASIDSIRDTQFIKWHVFLAGYSLIQPWIRCFCLFCTVSVSRAKSAFSVPLLSDRCRDAGIPCNQGCRIPIPTEQSVTLPWRKVTTCHVKSSSRNAHVSGLNGRAISSSPSDAQGAAVYCFCMLAHKKKDIHVIGNEWGLCFDDIIKPLCFQIIHCWQATCTTVADWNDHHCATSPAKPQHMVNIQMNVVYVIVEQKTTKSCRPLPAGILNCFV